MAIVRKVIVMVMLLEGLDTILEVEVMYIIERTFPEDNRSVLFYVLENRR